ncbi:pyridoxamine 5'-phosphate oxidase domain protein [Metarhizium robertsii]|uniref:Pyridoxamine 5'-phosphate oxidase domain protein n=1 Tax=Metarhizium robertsii TaxID=568076 RepID=A0A0A1UME1_9HYPO|nr:pyridoxamine 5'-phosphate oxidase domain protein [Metarhizium robertsii]
MVHFYDSIPESLQKWALEQPLFFTATAPLHGRHINLSPKGLTSATFHIFDGNHVAYIDTAGSGVETISHIYENGRVTIMFCSIDSKPRIMRLFCTGTVVERNDFRFAKLLDDMGKTPVAGTRAVILLQVRKAQTSCGYGVPVVENRDAHAKHLETSPAGACSCFSDRPTLEKALKQMEKKNSLDDYILKMNTRSLDGLLGLREARQMNGEFLPLGDAMAVVDRRLNHPGALLAGILLGVILTILVGRLETALDILPRKAYMVS